MNENTALTLRCELVRMVDENLTNQRTKFLPALVNDDEVVGQQAFDNLITALATTIIVLHDTIMLYFSHMQDDAALQAVRRLIRHGYECAEFLMSRDDLDRNVEAPQAMKFDQDIQEFQFVLQEFKTQYLQQ